MTFVRKITGLKNSSIYRILSFLTCQLVQELNTNKPYKHSTNIVAPPGAVGCKVNLEFCYLNKIKY